MLKTSRLAFLIPVLILGLSACSTAPVETELASASASASAVIDPADVETLEEAISLATSIDPASEGASNRILNTASALSRTARAELGAKLTSAELERYRVRLLQVKTEVVPLKDGDDAEISVVNSSLRDIAIELDRAQG